MEITFDQLPMAVCQVYDKLEKIEQLLCQKNTPRIEGDAWFDLAQLINYLPDKPAAATVYGWVQLGSIPYYKTGKKLRFLKSEIDEWLKTGKRKTVTQLNSEADDCLNISNKKRG